jgi:hypothetical protein
MSASSSARHLPAPHDPRERSRVATVGDWDVFVFAPGDFRHAYFATRGFLHLQLWHRTRNVSLLTPSALTARTFELAGEPAWKYRASSYERLRGETREVLGIDLPNPSALRAFERWFVSRYEREAERAS